MQSDKELTAQEQEGQQSPQPDQEKNNEQIVTDELLLAQKLIQDKLQERFGESPDQKAEKQETQQSQENLEAQESQKSLKADSIAPVSDIGQNSDLEMHDRKKIEMTPLFKDEANYKLMQEAKQSHDSQSKIEDETSDSSVGADARKVYQASYSIHEFVKMNTVFEKIQECIEPYASKLRLKDQELRNQKAEITNMKQQIGQAQGHIQQLFKFERGNKVLNTQFKAFKADTEKIQADHQSLISELDRKRELTDTTLEQQNFEIDQLKKRDEFLLEHTEQLRFDMTANENKLKDHINVFKVNVLREIGEIQDLVRPVKESMTLMTKKIDSQATNILNMCKKNIQDVIEQMKEDSKKIQTMEVKIRSFESLQHKMKELKSMEISNKKTADQVHDVHKFVERTVPMMIHLHVCEALNVTVANDMNMLIDFQKKKLEEIYRYVKSSEGKSTKINNFRRCVEAHCKHFWNRDKGVSSFIYGEDYSVGMAENVVEDVDKKEEIREWLQDMDNKEEIAKNKAYEQMEEIFKKVFPIKLEKHPINKKIVMCESVLKKATKTLDKLDVDVKRLGSDLAMIKIASPRGGGQAKGGKNKTNTHSSQDSQMGSQPQIAKTGSQMQVAAEQTMKNRMNSKAISQTANEYEDQATNKKGSIFKSQSSIDVGSQIDLNTSQPNRGNRGMVVLNHKNACYERKIQKRMRKYYDMGLQQIDSIFAEFQELAQYCEILQEERAQEQQVMLKWNQEIENNLKGMIQNMFKQKYRKDKSDETQNDRQEFKENYMDDNFDDEPTYFKPQQVSDQQNTLTKKNLEELDKSPLSKSDSSSQSSSKQSASIDQSSDKQSSVKEPSVKDEMPKHNFVKQLTGAQLTKDVIQQMNKVEQPKQKPKTNFTKQRVGARLTNSVLQQMVKGKPQDEEGKKSSKDTTPQLSAKSDRSKSQAVSPTKVSPLAKIMEKRGKVQGVWNQSFGAKTDSPKKSNMKEKFGAGIKAKVGALMGSIAGGMGGMANNVQAGPPGLSEPEIVELIKKHTLFIHENVEEQSKMIEKNVLDLNNLVTFAEIKMKDGIKEIKDQTDVKAQELDERLSKICKETTDHCLTKLDTGYARIEEAIKLSESCLNRTIHLEDVFKNDYQVFIREKHRWKSDFDNAARKATTNFDTIHSTLQEAVEKSMFNSHLIKMVIDAQMIDQLVQRADVEDKKKLGLFGKRNAEQQLNPSLAPEYTSGGRFSKSPRGRRQDEKENSQQDHANNEMFTDHQEVLKVDKSCLQCSGNMTQVLHQLKLACLSYTQSPVKYQDRKYQVSELLRVKAGVIAKAQRTIREKIYETDKHSGQAIRDLPDERGFIIEPLLQADNYLKPTRTKKRPRLVEADTDRFESESGQDDLENFADTLKEKFKTGTRRGGDHMQTQQAHDLRIQEAKRTRANCSSVLISKKSKREVDIPICHLESNSIMDHSPLKPAIQARNGSVAAQIRVFDDGHGVHLREANNRLELLESAKQEELYRRNIQNFDIQKDSAIKNKVQQRAGSTFDYTTKSQGSGNPRLDAYRRRANVTMVSKESQAAGPIIQFPGAANLQTTKRPHTQAGNQGGRKANLNNIRVSGNNFNSTLTMFQEGGFGRLKPETPKIPTTNEAISSRKYQDALSQPTKDTQGSDSMIRRKSIELNVKLRRQASPEESPIPQHLSAVATKE